MTITLPPALERLVREKVGSGLYANETDVVCDALRREFAHDEFHEWVRAKAAAGFAELDAGEFEEITREEFVSRLGRLRT